jgi:hypothetical protein
MQSTQSRPAARAVIRFRYDSARDCTAIGTCGFTYPRDVTRAGVCNTFPWGIRSIAIDSLDPQCKCEFSPVL